MALHPPSSLSSALLGLGPTQPCLKRHPYGTITERRWRKRTYLTSPHHLLISFNHQDLPWLDIGYCTVKLRLSRPRRSVATATCAHRSATSLDSIIGNTKHQNLDYQEFSLRLLSSTQPGVDNHFAQPLRPRGLTSFSITYCHNRQFTIYSRFVPSDELIQST